VCFNLIVKINILLKDQEKVALPGFLFLFFLIKKETKKLRQNECSAVLPCQRHGTSMLHHKSVEKQFRFSVAF
jgi:hypothetical protein